MEWYVMLCWISLTEWSTIRAKWKLFLFRILFLFTHEHAHTHTHNLYYILFFMLIILRWHRHKNLFHNMYVVRPWCPTRALMVPDSIYYICVCDGSKNVSARVCYELWTGLQDTFDTASIMPSERKKRKMMTRMGRATISSSWGYIGFWSN